MAAYGAKWGFAMINQSPIPENAATAIRSVFEGSPNHLRQAESELTEWIEEARVAREIEETRPSKALPKEPAPQHPEAIDQSPQETSLAGYASDRAS